MPDIDLLGIFHAQQGVVSCVGAGGKKTTMFRLAFAHSGRVGITATAHIEFFPKELPAKNYIADEEALLKAIAEDTESQRIAFARPSSRFGRRAGVSLEGINAFQKAGNFNLMVIKADGARGRFIKAPSEHEPAISPYSDTVIPILSAHVIGQPLTEAIAHRVEHLSEVTGLENGKTIEPVHIARLLASEQGSLKSTGQARVVPLINMVDNPELEHTARIAAEQALQMTDRFDKVVLAAMKKDKPIVDVVERTL